MSEGKVAVLVPYTDGYPCTFVSWKLSESLIDKKEDEVQEAKRKVEVAREVLAGMGNPSPTKIEIEAIIAKISWSHNIRRPCCHLPSCKKTKISVQDLAPA